MADLSVTQQDCEVQCRVCGDKKPRTGFYPKQVRKSGDVGECKECTKRRVKVRSRENPAVRKYDRERAKLPHRKAKAAKYLKQWREENPEAHAAHIAVRNALRSGALKRLPCMFCGAGEHVHAHHRDYSKPLDVKWLCAKCHHRLHAEFPETAAHEVRA